MTKNTIRGVHDKYRSLLFFLVILQIFGNIGGACQPVRLFVISLLPLLFANFKRVLLFKFVFLFFLFWIVYALLSLLWVVDFGEAIAEIFYLSINFLCFFVFVLLAEKVNDPIKVITNAWVFLFVLTVPIALYELLFDVHLWTTVFEDGMLIGGGDGVVKKFAAVTFGNYNGYVLLLIYVSPFVASQCLYATSERRKILGWILFFILFYILLMIASRSGLLAIIVLLIVLLYYYKTVSFEKRFLVYSSVFIAIVLLLYFFSESLLEQIAYRLAGSELFQDSTREDLISAAFRMFLDSLFLGVGAGNYVTVSKSYISMNSFPPHNLFMEILSQYGIYIFVCFVVFILKIFFTKKTLDQRGFILTSAFLLFPFISIVDSGYLRNILLWMWLASLFVLSKQQNYG